MFWKEFDSSLADTFYWAVGEDFEGSFLFQSMCVYRAAIQQPVTPYWAGIFETKGQSLPISLPLPEIFLAGLHVATMPCDSVIASWAVRGHSRALHKQAVQAVSKRAEKRR